MNTGKHGLKEFCYRRGHVAMMTCALVASLCGCTYSLHPSNTPSEQSLKIVSEAPQKYLVRVDGSPGDEHKDYPVGSDGIVRFRVPQLPRGCAVRLFGVIKVADNKSEDVRAIQLIKDGKTVRKLSLNDITKLPVGTNGVREVRIK